MMVNYGGLIRDHYDHIFSSMLATRMCGIDDEEMFALVFRERTEDDPVSTYWGWQDTDSEDCSMIQPTWVQFSVCFAYGVKAEEEAGRGRRVNLTLVSSRLISELQKQYDEDHENG